MDTGAVTDSPRPFREIPGLWNKIFKMDEAFFVAEAPRVSKGNTLIAVLIYAVFCTILGFINRPAKQMESLQNISPALSQGILIVVYIFATMVLLATVLIGFYIGIGLLHLVSRMFKGQGSFATLAYLQSLFIFPIIILTTIGSLIPYLGILLNFVLLVFQIILTVRTLKATYRFTTGRAVGVLGLMLTFWLVIGLFLITGFVLLGNIGSSSG